jgi:hypothetical protein
MLLATASLAWAAESPQIENRKLTWTEFQGQPEADSPFDAYVYWSVHCSYDAPMREGDGFRVPIRVWNQLDARSWVKPQVHLNQQKAELLNHEQGHYTIGVLCALEFKQAVSGRIFDGNYHAEIRRILDHVQQKYLALEKAYDAETSHMRDEARQAFWDRRLAQLVSERWGNR